MDFGSQNFLIYFTRKAGNNGGFLYTLYISYYYTNLCLRKFVQDSNTLLAEMGNQDNVNKDHKICPIVWDRLSKTTRRHRKQQLQNNTPHITEKAQSFSHCWLPLCFFFLASCSPWQMQADTPSRKKISTVISSCHLDPCFYPVHSS